MFFLPCLFCSTCHIYSLISRYSNLFSHAVEKIGVLGDEAIKFNDHYNISGSTVSTLVSILLPLFFFCRLSLDVKCMLFLVLQSLSLDLFVVMGYRSAERLVEGMAIYQVQY
jgi:hypothetical protein